MRQIEIQRAIRACRAEGETVKGVEISSDSTVRILLAAPNDNEATKAADLEKRIQNGLGTVECPV